MYKSRRRKLQKAFFLIKKKVLMKNGKFTELSKGLDIINKVILCKNKKDLVFQRLKFMNSTCEIKAQLIENIRLGVKILHVMEKRRRRLFRV